MAERNVALVCGASSGIGRSTAILLAQAGWSLALAARHEGRLNETAAAARANAPAGVEVETLVVDLQDADATRCLIDRVNQRFGRIDALANVAGVAPLLAIEQLTPDVIRQCLVGNLGYVANLTAAVWPILRRQGRGVIVNVSSLASVDPFPNFSIYAAAKIGVNMFTRCTAQEGKDIGVKAVCIAPGAVETPMLRGLFNESLIPRDKALAPQAVAGVIRDCILGQRAFESGETILVPSP